MPKIRNKGQKARFLLVGASATAIDFGLLFMFRYVFNLPVIPANIGATGIAFVYSFFANKKFTFKSDADGKSVLREMVLFTVTTLFGLWVIQSAIINFLLPVVGNFVQTPSLALLGTKLVATGVTMIWNYFMYSRIVFKRKHQQA